MKRWIRTSLLALLASGSLAGIGASASAQPESEAAAEPAPETPAAGPAPAPAVATHAASPWDSLKPELLWYLSAGYGESGGDAYSDTRIGRGYLTLKAKPADWFESRVTIDTHQDAEGSWGTRLKYLYGKLVLPKKVGGFINEPNVEFGLVHTPWLDYEEHVDNYRMQGTMFVERNKNFNSADSGITVGALFGDKLDADYQKKVSKAYPGQWGSAAVGIYNGGGYHATEQNRNKALEWRVSVRPGGHALPNLQLSNQGVYGRGNQPAGPEWRLNGFMASYEHEYFVATAQYLFGRGNQAGDKVDATGEPLDLSGYSGFLELKLPQAHSAVIARYDAFKWGDASDTTRVIAGWAYYLLGKNILLLDYDRTSADDWETKLTLQVHYP